MTTRLPRGWEWASVADVAEVQGGIQKQPKRRPDRNHFPFLRVANVLRSRLDLSEVHEVELFDGELEKYALAPGDLLVVEGNGSPSEIGRAALWKGQLPNCVHQNHLIRVRPSSVVDARYLAALWNSPVVAAELRAVASSTSGLLVLTTKKIRSVRIPVAPLDEQRRIVTAIEEETSRLEGAIGLVKSGLARLPLVRRGVLARVMPDPLPDGWKLLTVEETGTVELGRQRSPRYHSGPNMKPYLRVANVHEDRIDLGDVKEMDFPPEQLPRYELRPGDILLNEGQSPEFVGRPAMYRGELPGVCFTNSIIRFQPFDFVDGEYALLVFLRHLRFGRFQREAQITTNIAHMAAGRFKKVEFPVPPLDEQLAIVDEVRRDLSLLSAFESELKTSLRRADTLRAAILAAAFRGELVPQDPADAPATELLARIEADRPPAREGKRKGA